ncbi:hypothetical protein D3C84_1073250 [compost metagenome]
MPGLALEQTEIELAQLFIQMRYQRLETLATAGLDERADHQRVHQFHRLMAAHNLAQPRGVAPGGQLAQFDLAPFHQAHDLFVVHQFFPGQARHQIDQVNV